MLDGREHLTHDIRSMSLSEPLRGHNSIEELASPAMLHHDVHVAMIDKALVKLDNVWVINSLKDCQLLLQKSNVFCNVFPED